MKKSSVLMIAATLLLSSCGTLTQLASSGSGQKFQDGIYGSKPDFKAKEEKVRSKAETEALIAKTQESPIYLFGDKKDSIIIPDNYAATIKYDRQLGSTVVTVGENPFDWRNNINPWSYYTPYSIGSSWYWSRHWDPFWSMSPLGYGWHDPWYYGGYWGRWYDPWYYSNFWGWDPWYYTGYWGGWYGYPYYYAGWYGGFGPHWGHNHPMHGPGHIGGGLPAGNISSTPRYEAQRTEKISASTAIPVARRGFGESSSTGRGTVGSSSTPRNTFTPASQSASSRKTMTEAGSVSRPATTYRRPAVSNGSGVGTTSATRGSENSSETRSTVGRSSANYDHSSSGSYNRGTTSTQTRSSSYNSGSSAGRSGGGYSGGGNSGGGGSYSRGGSGGGGRR